MPKSKRLRVMVRQDQEKMGKLKKLRYRLQRGISREGDQWAQGKQTYKQIRPFLPLEYSGRLLAVAQGGVDLVSEEGESYTNFEGRVRDLVKPYIIYGPYIILHKPLSAKSLEVRKLREDAKRTLWTPEPDSEEEEYELIEGPKDEGQEEEEQDQLEGVEGSEEGEGEGDGFPIDEDLERGDLESCEENEDGGPGKKKGTKKKKKQGKSQARGPAFEQDVNEELLYDDGMEDSKKMKWLDELQAEIQGQDMDDFDLEDLESASEPENAPQGPSNRANGQGSSSTGSSSFRKPGKRKPSEDFPARPLGGLVGAIDVD